MRSCWRRLGSTMSAGSPPSALHCDLERARPLSQLVYEKTGGNPFFAIQFLTELAEEGLLAFQSCYASLAMGTRSHPREGLHR